jgi:hypothetical protein
MGPKTGNREQREQNRDQKQVTQEQGTGTENKEQETRGTCNTEHRKINRKVGTNMEQVKEKKELGTWN